VLAGSKGPIVDQSFPETEETVQATLARVLDLKGMRAEVQLLRMAAVSIQHTDHDNWNGGVDYYTIRLHVPLEVFVQIEPEIESHEKRLLDVAKSIWRDYESDFISAVRLLPDRSGLASPQSAHLAPTQLPAFWEPDHFRLFLSHCSSRKVEVGLLRVALRDFGVSGFVAHDDIEPSQLWQPEIERALRSCEALAAIVTEDFSASLWCDQEVGYALGRGLPILPIQLGRPPHGFIAKVQALPVPKGHTLASIAPNIVGLLLKAPQSSLSSTGALVHAVANAYSFAQAKAATALLESVPVLNDAHASLLRDALTGNSQVIDAFGVPDRILRILKSHGV
jgi:hypothetical protein